MLTSQLVRATYWLAQTVLHAYSSCSLLQLACTAAWQVYVGKLQTHRSTSSKACAAEVHIYSFYFTRHCSIVIGFRQHRL